MTDHVSLATRFLTSSASGTTTEPALRAFLERKGLTTSEINEALSVTRKGGGGVGGAGGPGWSWLISWIALPLAVLGTGVLVLKLTGGEEEFPKPAEQEQEQNQQLQLQASSQALSVGDFGPSSGAGGSDEWTMLREEHNEPPEWAKELQQMTLALSEDIQFIKGKLLEMENAGKSNEGGVEPKSDPPADAPKPPSLETRLSLVREAFRHMIQASAGSEEAMKKCSGALSMYIKMLVENPDTPRYRRISVANESFKSLVQPVIGADKVLESVGFALRGLYYEWTWISDSVSMDETSRTRVLTECLQLLERAKQDGCSAVVDGDDHTSPSMAEEAPSVSQPEKIDAVAAVTHDETLNEDRPVTPPRREASTIPSMVEITRALKSKESLRDQSTAAVSDAKAQAEQTANNAESQAEQAMSDAKSQAEEALFLSSGEYEGKGSSLLT
jgi:hypothetical protein